MQQMPDSRPRTQATGDPLGLAGGHGLGGKHALGEGVGGKHGLVLKPPRTREGLQGLEEEDAMRRRNSKNDIHDTHDDASERRRRTQGHVPNMSGTMAGGNLPMSMAGNSLGPSPVVPDLSGGHGYSLLQPPPSRGEGQRNKPHFIKDPKRMSMDTPMMMKMEVLADPKSPRNQQGYGSLSKSGHKQASKAYSKHHVPALVPQSEMRSSKSSHGHGGRLNPLKQEGNLSNSSTAYKSVAGYNSMQIPEEDRLLLQSMPLE
jgi:hypothetical protein